MLRPRAATPVLIALGLAASAAVPAASAASAAPAPSRPLAGKVIVLDPGHNGYNYRIPASCNTTGTQTNRGYPEHASNWDVAQRTKRRLTALGARVVLTRSNDTGQGPCNTVRGRIPNDVKADAFVSIHSDGAPTRVRGLHVIWDGGRAVPAAMRPENQRLARALRTALVRATGMPPAKYIADGSGVQQRTDLVGLSTSKRPSALIEVGNMRNATDASLLSSATFREKEAAGIVAGLRAYLRR